MLISRNERRFVIKLFAGGLQLGNLRAIFVGSIVQEDRARFRGMIKLVGSLGEILCERLALPKVYCRIQL